MKRRHRLFGRSRHAERTEGEVTEDGKVIVHYDVKGIIAATKNTNKTVV